LLNSDTAQAEKGPVGESPSASRETAGATDQQGPGGLAASLRARILAYIQGELGGAQQEVLLSTRAIADALDASAHSVAYHLNRLAQAGHVHTRRAGPKGTWFRPGGGALASVRPRAARGQVAASATPAAAKARVNFCPYCGTRVAAADWLYCAGCGRGLD